MIPKGQPTRSPPMRSPSPPTPATHSPAARLPSNRGFGGIPRSLSVLLLDGHAEVIPAKLAPSARHPVPKQLIPAPKFRKMSTQIPPRPLLSSADCCPHNKNNAYFNAVAFLFYAFAASRNNIFSKILSGCVSVFDSYSSNNRITMSSCPGMASKSSIDRMLPSY